MLGGGRSRPRLRDERGVYVVLFAFLIPLFIALGAIVFDVGNWYVHRRHLQTQADAAALAGGQLLFGCLQDPSGANANVAQQALRYAGDPTRDALTKNLQVQSQSNVHVVLNSHDYWTSGTALGTSGYTSTPDWSDVSGAAGAPKLGPAGQPCYNGYIDVKATDDKAPKLWGLVPFTASPKTTARVVLYQAIGTQGVLPLGLPEYNPKWVAAIIVNEDAANWQTNANAVVGAQFLAQQNPPPPLLSALNVFQGALSGLDISGASDFGVFILQSRNASAPSLSGSLDSMCAQTPVPAAELECYAYDGSGQEVSFIHAYSDASPATAASPKLREAPISGGCGSDLSTPYFNKNGGCPMVMSAHVDFGVAAGQNPMDPPSQGGVCADVTSNVGTVGYSGGSSSIWTITFTPPDNTTSTGRFPINLTGLTYKVGNNGKCNNTVNTTATLGTAGAPYTSDVNGNSGPIQYLWVVNNANGTAANSMNRNSSASLTVTVGLTPPLSDTPPGTPPIEFRLGNFNQPSQTQALDCGTGAAGFRNAIINGCPNFSINQRNGICTTPYPNPASPDCIASQNGNFSVGTAYQARFTPQGCAKDPNNWYRNGYTVPPAGDPRWAALFVLDNQAFTVSGKKYYPIRNFISIYVTAGDSLGCPGDDPAGTTGSGPRELWGHVTTYLTTDPNATPGPTQCSFTGGGLCVPILVK
jgi:hypothetical protein